MKKVLIVFDGWHFSEGAINFAKRLNDTGPILLTGIFLPSVDYSDAMIYYVGGMVGPIYTPVIDLDPTVKEKNIQKFRQLCLQYGIEHRVHDLSGGSVLADLSKETRYADLMLLSSELFYENLGEDTSDEYIEETLHRAECPVVLVPEQYDFPLNSIIAFDGSRSSVFALKQFAYLFPQFSNKPALLVHASAKNAEIPDLPYIEEYAARHFSELIIFGLDADPKKYFNTWLSTRNNTILVAGSFGRSDISELFRKNFISDVLKEHRLPIFIAHK